MLEWALILLVLAVIAAVIGFRFLMAIGKILFVILLIGFIIVLVFWLGVC